MRMFITSEPVFYATGWYAAVITDIIMFILSHLIEVFVSFKMS